MVIGVSPFLADGRVLDAELASDPARPAVATILSRLHAKGTLERERQARGYAYRPIDDPHGLTALLMYGELDRDSDRATILRRLLDVRSPEPPWKGTRRVSRTARARRPAMPPRVVRGCGRGSRRPGVPPGPDGPSRPGPTRVRRGNGRPPRREPRRVAVRAIGRTSRSCRRCAVRAGGPAASPRERESPGDRRRAVAVAGHGPRRPSARTAGAAPGRCSAPRTACAVRARAAGRRGVRGPGVPPPRDGDRRHAPWGSPYGSGPRPVSGSRRPAHAL
ncbi:BlaI/MecI/CopY family transcriptional regulator [Streptomyces sp. K1PN6]|uniref:BlaI/MecI/CopY family transcriptional regulator n=1 Tax=Streptomyces acidicola TaxID=2596892 RepID=A0A5N8WVU1_9ACTN|nr:BlaI/MecI/CopY family transcriptional regulator [Streptomyces acidicola]